MIAETNQAYIDSGVNQRLVLVANEAMEYTESGSSGTDLYRLRAASDGFMDEVHAIRDRLGADLVHLFADTQPAIAYRPGSFGVTSNNSDSRFLAHELGHNMGLSHDRRETSSRAVFPFSYGYVNQRPCSGMAPAVTRWFTLMAYPSQCRDAGFRCTWLMRFSNPNKTNHRQPLGLPGDNRTMAFDGPSEAARTLNITRTSVANFRARASGNQSPSKSTPSLARSASMPVKPSGGATEAWGGAFFGTVAPKGQVIASPRAVASSDSRPLGLREVTVDLGM